MKAFLTSGDLTENQVLEFEELLGKSKVSKALFITTAAVPYGFDPKPEWLNNSIQDMSQFAESITETSLEAGDLIPSDLDQFGFIFVTGGNTFYLANRLVEVGLDKKIKKFIEKGGIYSGSSAGAIILMYNIENFKPADDASVVSKIYPGLGLLDFAIIPHADNEKYSDVMKDVGLSYQNEGKEVIFLGDNQVLVINGEKRKVI